MHESDPEGGLGVEALARDEEPPGGTRTDLREHERRDDRGDDAELHLGEAELRGGCGNRDVRTRSEAGAAAEGGAVDARDDRCGAAVYGLQHAPEQHGVRDVLLVRVVDGRAHPVDVGTRAERGSFAREHDHAGIAHVGEGLVQLLDERGVERVSTLGPRQRDPEDPAVSLAAKRAHAWQLKVRGVARIVVAGGGAMGASIAYHLALRGARDVVLAERGAIAGGSTGKAMGGVRQQFSTAPEVELARDSIRFFEELGPPLYEQVGYLFLATTEEGLAALEARRETQVSLGVPVERLSPGRVGGLIPGLRIDDVAGAVYCATDGVADTAGVARELVRRAAERGVDVREQTPAETVKADVLVIACGPWSAELASRFGVELPIRPLVRQLLETVPVAGLPRGLPMTVEAESGFHFRRRGERLVLAMADSEPRWGTEERVDETVFGDRLERLAHRFPPAAEARLERAWAGLYDMTPDAHPIIGRADDSLYLACGFSGHGFMQSPAVGAAVAEELLDGESSFDLSPYRLERFGGETLFPETIVL